MILKNYQKATLAVVKKYFELARQKSPAEAYREITGDYDMILRLGAQRGYNTAENMDDTPVVAIKVPTGGGKTILAAHAIKLIAETQGREFPLVIWFAPSDTIRRQTAEALKKPSHPYRQALDAAFQGRVRVFDLDQKFEIRPSDIAQNVCIVVATEQAFVKTDKEKYKVYVDHENLEPHFAAVTLEPGMDARDDDKTKPKCSLANLLLHHRAVIVVDEAHKMVSELSQKTISRLGPSAVLGLTATPEKGNNTVYSVWAKELFDEEMVKLPIQLKEFESDWTSAVIESIAKREELQKLADAEYGAGASYLRPLVLFQATNVKGDVPVDKLKAFLIDDAKCKPEEIAVVTGEQKELDGVDVNDPKCHVKYIITVQALKEGWDCPSAYILCSVANVESNTDTVQLLGRVMRQPEARRRKTHQLNRAYAFVLSKTFGASAEELVNGLRKRGFEQDEAYQAIEVQTEFLEIREEDTLFYQSDRLSIEREVLDAVSTDLPDSVKVDLSADGDGMLKIDGAISAEDLAAVKKAFDSRGYTKLAVEFARRVEAQRKIATDNVPAKSKTLVLPRILAKVQGELVFNGEGAYEAVGDGIEKLLPPVLGEEEFKIVPSGHGFQLFLDGNELKAKVSEHVEEQYMPGYSGVLDHSHIVNALDAILKSDLFSPYAKHEWIAKIVSHLVFVRNYKPDQIFGCRYQLRNVLGRHIEQAYQKTCENAYQEVFGFEEHKYPLALDFENGFTFDAHLYENDFQPIKFYEGHWHFTKHFLGPHRIPKFDGQKPFGEGEEYDCAVQIDSHPQVEFWLRNLDSHKQSFSLPLAHGRFYPDFVGRLKDGRIFVIEYKGAHLRQSPDTTAKDSIGRLWAKQDPARFLYSTIFLMSESGLNVRAQLDQLFY